MKNLKRKSSIDHSIHGNTPRDLKRLRDCDDDTISPARTPSDDATSNLLKLLDVSALTNPSEIQNRFTQLATLILHQLDLVIRDTEGVETILEVLELEFYLWATGCHEDPFTHGNVEQGIRGMWYFHRAPRKSLDSRESLTSNSGYRGGTRKGLDLTIGASPNSFNASPYFPPSTPTPTPTPTSVASASSSEETETKKLRGGALLRTFRHKSNGKIISGPSLLVDEVLKLSGASSISNLVENYWKGDISAFRVPVPVPDAASSKKVGRSSALYFRNRTRNTNADTDTSRIYQSPRIGLDLSHPDTKPTRDHPRVIFLPKLYRYFIYPKLLTANGRPQTFIGVVDSLGFGFPLDDDDEVESRCSRLKQMVAEVMGMKEQSVAGYVSHYKAGYELGKLEPFIGKAGKGASSAPAVYLRMMGALRTLA